MSVRQRLRRVLDLRRYQRICWTCALSLPRYSSTAQGAPTDRSNDPGPDDFATLSSENWELVIRHGLGIDIPERLSQLGTRKRPRQSSSPEQHSTNGRDALHRDTSDRRAAGRRPVMTRLSRREDAYIGWNDLDNNGVDNIPSDNTVATVPPAQEPASKNYTIRKMLAPPLRSFRKTPVPSSKLHTLGLQKRNGEKPVEQTPGVGIDSTENSHVQLATPGSLFRKHVVKPQIQIKKRHDPGSFRKYSKRGDGNDSVIRSDGTVFTKKDVGLLPSANLRDSGVTELSNQKPGTKNPSSAMSRDGMTEPCMRKYTKKDKNTLVVTQSNGAVFEIRRSELDSQDAQENHAESPDFHEELDSVLDAFKDLHSSKATNTTSSSKIRQARPRSTSSLERAAKQYYGHASIESSQKMSYSTFLPRVHSRGYTSTHTQYNSISAHTPIPIGENIANSDFDLSGGNVREHLRLWQEQQQLSIATFISGSSGTPQNLITQSGEDDGYTTVLRDDEPESDDYLNLSSEERTLEILSPHSFLRQGDLVELWTNEQPIVAVFIRNLSLDQCQFYTERGKWVHRGHRMIKFSVPKFVHPRELSDLLPHLPLHEIVAEMMDQLQPLDINAPRDAGAKVLEKMQRFHEASDTVFRKHADRLNRTYEIMAPQSITRGRITKNLEEVALKVLQKNKASNLTPPELWTVHRTLVQIQNVLIDRRSHRVDPVFEFLPQKKLKDMDKVKNWAREYREKVVESASESFPVTLASGTDAPHENPITTFARKARRAIKRSRQTRRLTPVGSLGPSSSKVGLTKPDLAVWRENQEGSIAFDSREKLIIKYLDAWVASRHLNKFSDLASVGPTILRAIGEYDGLSLSAATGFTLLQELGLVTPWENNKTFGSTLELPGLDKYHPITVLRNQARASLPNLELQDSMANLRKDWGDLAVFCVDSADTTERDDGISLQYIEDDASVYWVHIHVANPSAFITPESAFGRYAANLGESIYLPERKYSMLEPELLEKHLSLRKDRPCITVSAKMTAGGDILEKQISHGVIHNVHYLTPQRISRELGFSESDSYGSNSVSLLTVGGTRPASIAKAPQQNPETDRALSPSDIDVLRKLRDIGEAARCRRERSGAANFNTLSNMRANVHPEIYLSAHDKNTPTIDTSRTKQIDGDPIISIERPTRSTDIVSEMIQDLMILAGEICASWSAERNLPIPFRGIVRNPEPASPPAVYKKQFLDPQIEQRGYADGPHLLTYMKLLGQSGCSSTPLEHIALGLPAYVKATSPLRRYLDLFTHWQIEAAIRHEANTQSSLIGSTRHSFLPFSRVEVEATARRYLSQTYRILTARNDSQRHWISQALSRAFYFNEAPLPESFAVNITHKAGGGSAEAGGWMEGWGIKASMLSTTKEGGFNIGDVWEARLKEVNTYDKTIMMEPVRLLSRDSSSS